VKDIHRPVSVVPTPGYSQATNDRLHLDSRRDERTIEVMTNPESTAFGDDGPEAEDTWRDAARLTGVRDWEASEADLIEQAIAVPDDESEFDR
jgi:hypothetical protein